MPKVIVVHAGYGCDTGCCGHVVEVDGYRVSESFTFDHPRLWDKKTDAERQAEIREFVRERVIAQMGEEHCQDIDWENCIVSDD